MLRWVVGIVKNKREGKVREGKVREGKIQAGECEKEKFEERKIQEERIKREHILRKKMCSILYPISTWRTRDDFTTRLDSYVPPSKD